MEQNQAGYISGADFARMIASAHQAFLREHEYINRLNVFPVPDGDTGSNMLLTLGAVNKAVSEAPDGSIGLISKRAADSALMGARGNSGVLLSQIFRGIARGLSGKEQASAAIIGKAFQYGILYAYRAVAKPVEGTILTVAKGIAKGARRAVREQAQFADILADAIAAGETELARTPELLPALKAAGVVDAGGYGLIVFLKGCLEGLGGGYGGPEAGFDAALYLADGGPEAEHTLAHPYCTEFLVLSPVITVAEAREKLTGLGESLVAAEGEALLKIHIHTAHPGQVLEMALNWGALTDIKIDNMSRQRRSMAAGGRRVGVICVAAGDGLVEMARSLGAIVVAGGQTMNPPVEKFIDAVHTGGADSYIILPNNKNIILAAAQAQKLLGGNITILPTVSIVEGLAALLAFDEAKSPEENVAAMRTRLAGVREGAVTKAVRAAVLADEKIAVGDFIGITGGKVVLRDGTLTGAAVRLAGELAAQKGELVSLYYGADVSQEQAQELADSLWQAWPELAVEIYAGGQPHYHLFLSVE